MGEQPIPGVTTLVAARNLDPPVRATHLLVLEETAAQNALDRDPTLERVFSGAETVVYRIRGS
jgi:hypothetical protein